MPKLPRYRVSLALSPHWKPLLLYRLAWCIYWQCVAGDGIGSLTACSYRLAVCGRGADVHNGVWHVVKAIVGVVVGIVAPVVADVPMEIKKRVVSPPFHYCSCSVW